MATSREERHEIGAGFCTAAIVFAILALIGMLPFIGGCAAHAPASPPDDKQVKQEPTESPINKPSVLVQEQAPTTEDAPAQDAPQTVKAEDAAVSQREETPDQDVSPAGSVIHNPACDCTNCQCGTECACGLRYTAGGHSYRVKAGRVQVLVQQCHGTYCTQEYVDWYSLPESQRRAMRNTTRRPEAEALNPSQGGVRVQSPCDGGQCGYGRFGGRF
jgi:hypothetical protein